MMIFYRRKTIIDYIKYLIFKRTSVFVELGDEEFSLTKIYPEKPEFEYGLIAYFIRYEEIMSIRNIDMSNLIIRGKFEIVKTKYDPVSINKEIIENLEIHIDDSYMDYSKFKKKLYMKIYEVHGLVSNND